MPESEAQQPVSSSRQQRILVVDDNRDVADPFATLLATFGHEVEVAYDGETALAIAQRFRPEVTLLDLGMPGMDGYELARRLRELFPQETMILVALTGYEQSDDTARARGASFEHYLMKPIDIGEINELLDKLKD